MVQTLVSEISQSQWRQHYPAGERDGKPEHATENEVQHHGLASAVIRVLIWTGDQALGGAQGHASLSSWQMLGSRLVSPWKNILKKKQGQGLLKKLQGGNSGTEKTKYKPALPEVEFSSRDHVGPEPSSIFIKSQLRARFHTNCCILMSDPESRMETLTIHK